MEIIFNETLDDLFEEDLSQVKAEEYHHRRELV